MKVVCDYCESYIEATDEKCPNCGAPNTHFARTASDTPKTIEQLLDFCNKRNIPLEKLHMHIGENYQGPRAFGIYRDNNTGRFIVYKNKDSGERAIRYEGTDEAYAVNEIYMKVKDLVMDARENTATVNRTIPPLYQPTRNNTPNRRPWLKWVIIGLIALFILGGGLKNIGRYLRPYFGNIGSSSSSSSYSSSTWNADDNDSDSGGFFSNLFNSFDSDSDYDSDDSWFSSSDWDTDDDWDSGSDWDWSDSYDSYDYDSYDWDSDW